MQCILIFKSSKAVSGDKSSAGFELYVRHRDLKLLINSCMSSTCCLRAAHYHSEGKTFTRFRQKMNPVKLR